MTDSRLRLYVGTQRYSSWSLRPYLALAHTGAAFETVTIPLYRPDTKEQVAKISPSGRVPVLDHDGELIWDSLAICEYLSELFPEASLWPADRAQRARARSISAEMHAGFPDLRNDMTMDLLASEPGAGHTPRALADARRVMAIWREALATSDGPFLFGTFTIADAMFAPVTTRFTTYGVDLDPTCRAYVEAVQALPAFVAWKREAEAEATRAE